MIIITYQRGHNYILTLRGVSTYLRVIPVMARFVYCLLVLSFLSSLLVKGGEEDTNAFLQWFADNGGKYHGIGLVQTESMGRGVFAEADIAVGDKLIEVPKKLLISIDSLFKDSVDPINVRILQSFQTDEEILVCFLLIEKHKGISSFWKPYLDVLPEHVPNLLFYTDSELSLLEDVELKQKAKTSRIQTERKYADFVRIVKTLGIDMTVTLEQYFWAQSIFDSRGLRFQGN